VRGPDLLSAWADVRYRLVVRVRFLGAFIGRVGLDGLGFGNRRFRRFGAHQFSLEWLSSEAAIEGGVTGGIAASSRGGSLPAFGVASDLVTEAWVARRSPLGSAVWVGSCSGAEANDWSMAGVASSLWPMVDRN
jgi:hypothetical protein